MRVYPDTNVLFAALATRGLCADLLRALLAEHDVVVGQPVLGELRRNLAAKARLSPEKVEFALGFLLELEQAPAARPSAALRVRIDAGDLAVLACAARAGVDIVVTGDRALVELGSYAGIPIASPRELWNRLRRPSEG